MSLDTIDLRQPAPVVRRTVPTDRFPALTAARVVARGAMRGAVIWGAVFGFVVLAQVNNFVKDYPTPADIAQLIQTHAANIGIRVIFGPSLHVDTVGGYVSTHAVPVSSFIIAVWGLLAGTRLLRGEEDAGRWELLLAGRTTRRRAAAAGLAGLGAGLVTLWSVAAAGAVAVGRSADAHFSVSASLFLAAATVSSAAIFLAVGALCSQLAVTRRQAAGLAAGVFGVAFVLRVIAYSSSTLGWLHWATPLGWIDEFSPLTGSHPQVLALVAGAVGVLVAATIVLAGRRDLGAGVLPASDARRARTRLLGGPVGLAYRLSRGTTLGWVAGLATGGIFLGVITKGTADVWGDQSNGLAVRLTGATGGAAYLGMVFLIFAFLVAMAAAGQVGATREDEAEGFVDHLLARPVARLSWLSSRVAVSAAELVVLGLTAGMFTWAAAASTGADVSFWSLLAAGVNVVPPAVFVLGIGTLAHGVVPRLTGPVTYAVVAWSFLIEIIGASIGASRWLLDLSVFHHITPAPATAVSWDSAAILIATGLAAAATGALALTHRDLKGA